MLVAANLAARAAERQARVAAAGDGIVRMIAGRPMHIQCVGLGGPTLVLEAGLGDGASTWDLVFPELSGMTRTCRYDRAGYGGSTAGPFPRTAERVETELHALLKSAGEPGPFVLVGHSIGGLLVRGYAARYPGQVAGMILLDASHEDQYRRGVPDPRGTAFLDPAPLRAMFDWHAAPPAGALWTRRSELLQFDDYGAVAAPASLKNTPLLVMTAARKPAFLPIWLDLQRQLVGLSTNSAQWVDGTAGHYLQREHPESVIAAARCLIATVRAGADARVSDCPAP